VVVTADLSAAHVISAYRDAQELLVVVDRPPGPGEAISLPQVPDSWPSHMIEIMSILFMATNEIPRRELGSGAMQGSVLPCFRPLRPHGRCWLLSTR
jgi:hypothetical protein